MPIAARSTSTPGGDHSTILAREGGRGGDLFGSDLGWIGDVNLDGFDDLIVGSRGFDGAAGVNTGALTIISGADNSAITTLEGENSGDGLGSSVEGLGDYNGDGYPDYGAAANKHDGTAGVDSGKLYVFSGADDSLLFSDEVEQAGAGMDLRVAYVGDYNRDGHDDVAFGVRLHDGSSGVYCGHTRVYSGADNSVLLEIEGENADDQLGRVGTIGDYNLDGYDDIAIGAYHFDGAAGSDTGKVYVVSGADNSVLFSKEGSAAGDQLGGGGLSDRPFDFDRDGYIDLSVSARRHAGVTGADSGEVCVYAGRDAALLFSQEGENAADYLSYNSLSAGDFNHDGFDDLVFVSGDYESGSDIGKLYLQNGRGATALPGGNLKFSIEGESAGDHLGWFLARAGDFNGDGYTDLVVAASGYDGAAGSGTGKIYVYSGRDYGLIFSREGETAGDFFGRYVGPAGDFNQDGVDDIVVGALGYDGAAGIDSGKVYVYSGADHAELFAREGEGAASEFGWSVGWAGDFNRDGFDDIIVGANAFAGAAGSEAGKVYVYSGADGSELYSLEGENAFDQVGKTVCGGGDFDGDGYPDIAFGSTYFDSARGKLYLVSGRTRAFIRTHLGENVGDRFADAMASVGDVDADGFDDYAVGAEQLDGVAGANCGKIYVFSGRDGTLIFAREGETADDELGDRVAGGGDYNGDGYPDVVTGTAYFSGVAGVDAGKVYLYSGKDGSLLFSREGESAGGFFGVVGVGLGDWNRDGYGEVAVSAHQFDGAGGSRVGSGKIYVYSILP